MTRKYNSISRRKTPWDNLENVTPLESFLRCETKREYQEKHPDLRSTDEATLINSFDSSICPRCGSDHTKHIGFTKNGIISHYCFKCKHKFGPLTNTIFENHKISIRQWIDYWRNLLQYLSLNADSWNNKNAFTTSKYWFKKTCMILENYQDDIVLKDCVWYDVTYLPVRASDIQRHDNGHKLRGHSKNQLAIGTARDKSHVVIQVLGTGQPGQKRVYEKFKEHIAEGTKLITDKDVDHRLLVKKLNLVNEEYDSKVAKGMPDDQNHLQPINQLHSLLQKFLRAHSGFKREDLEDYCNLFAFIVNPPENKLEKIEILLKLGFENHKTLKYRDLFSVNKPHPQNK